ncbi:MAG: hypothetical protein IPG55_00545 [Saprospiraceae bacterium]|nr:hypothetical protein [Candidatus Defluviibacterium haderslevense]
MDFEIYLFGTFNGIHKHSPSNRYNKQFQRFTKNQIDNSQLTILRNQKTLYYAYTHELLEYKNNYFGICLVYKNNIYCSNVAKLYRLLEAVYLKVILKNGILLQEINGQTTFASPTQFKAEIEINRIDKIIRKNIKNLFKGDFKEIDNTFDQNKKQIIPQKVSIAKGNKYILGKTKEYPLLVVLPKKERLIKTTPIYEVNENEIVNSTENKQSENTKVEIKNNLKMYEEKSIQKQGNTQEWHDDISTIKPKERIFTLYNKILLGVAITVTIWAIISISKIYLLWVK